MFLWAWPPFEALFSATLERRFAATPFPAGDAPVIVVLSGNVFPPDPADPDALPGFGTYLRCSHAAWLRSHWKEVPILVTGGALRAGEATIVFADVMKRALIRDGVPADAIWTERESRSTYENALYSARILRERGVGRVVLVTEAFHMLRAVRSFRRQGIDVVPAPCGFRYLRFNAQLDSLLPSPSRMMLNEETLHEWLGLAWYAMTGKT